MGGFMKSIRLLVLAAALVLSYAVAAAAAFHDISVLRRKSGGHHIIDLAGHAIKALGQVSPLQFHHAAIGFIQRLLDKTCDQI